jgi:SecD/SecF fusion protein
MNQVLMRSVNTSLVVVLPILSLLLFGGETLKDFAFAMLIGVITGAYSSIFIATPILVILKEREPKYRQHRARLEGRSGERRLRPATAPAAGPAVEPAERATEGEPAVVGVPSASRTSPGGQPSQRPRPRSRKKPPAKRKRR